MKSRILSFLVPIVVLAFAPAAFGQTTSSTINQYTTTPAGNKVAPQATFLSPTGKHVLQVSPMSRPRPTTDSVTGQPSVATVITYAANGLQHVVGQLTVGYNATPTSTPGTNEIDTLTIGGTPTGGTFTLTFSGQTTAAITWSATNATLLANINTAIRALTNVTSTGFTATANSLTAGIGTITMTAGGPLGVSVIPLMTANGASLTGTSPTTVVTQATPGVATVTGGVTVQDGSGNVIFSTPILASGPIVLPFHVPAKGTANTAMIVTLAAGGTGVTGSLNAAHWTE